MRRIGDRPDGYRLRKVDPFFRLIPHIMPTRNDAEVFFEERVYIERTQELIRKLRKEGYRVGFLHIVLAAVVRTISQKPKMNRFVVGKRTYARKEISFSLAVKKEMTEKAEETTVKIKFNPTDTLYDVIEKVNNMIGANKGEDKSNETDKFAKLFHLLPNFIVAGLVGFIKFLDNHNMLPKFIIELSPFHSTMFITDLGSLGIRPVYHHIYNFGTNSVFAAFGVRSKEQIIDSDLTVNNKKAMDMRFVIDERIVDGFYFASAVKQAMRLIGSPESLLVPPKEVLVDDEI